MFRGWIWGVIALFALKRHFAREVRPHSEAQGYARADVLRVAHKALDQTFDAAWPGGATPQEQKP